MENQIPIDSSNSKLGPDLKRTLEEVKRDYRKLLTDELSAESDQHLQKSLMLKRLEKLKSLLEIKLPSLETTSLATLLDIEKKHIRDITIDLTSLRRNKKNIACSINKKYEELNSEYTNSYSKFELGAAAVTENNSRKSSKWDVLKQQLDEKIGKINVRMEEDNAKIEKIISLKSNSSFNKFQFVDLIHLEKEIEEVKADIHNFGEIESNFVEVVYETKEFFLETSTFTKIVDDLELNLGTENLQLSKLKDDSDSVKRNYLDHIENFKIVPNKSLKQLLSTQSQNFNIPDKDFILKDLESLEALLPTQDEKWLSLKRTILELKNQVKKLGYTYDEVNQNLLEYDEKFDNKPLNAMVEAKSVWKSFRDLVILGLEKICTKNASNTSCAPQLVFKDLQHGPVIANNRIELVKKTIENLEKIDLDFTLVANKIIGIFQRISEMEKYYNLEKLRKDYEKWFIDVIDNLKKELKFPESGSLSESESTVDPNVIVDKFVKELKISEIDKLKVEQEKLEKKDEGWYKEALKNDKELLRKTRNYYEEGAEDKKNIPNYRKNLIRKKQHEIQHAIEKAELQISQFPEHKSMNLMNLNLKTC